MPFPPVLLAAALAGAPAPIAPPLARALAAGEAEMLVVLREQADLSPAAALPDKRTKGRFVVGALRAAARAQAPLAAWLASRGRPFRSFLSVNAVWTRGDAALAGEIAARPEVLRLEANPWVRGIPPEPPSPRLAPLLASAGVTQVNAAAVWATGNHGEGIVVADADTGVLFTHDALKTRYRGWNGGSPVHDRNWHDAIHPPVDGGACGDDAPAPCDGNGHGTRTTGLMVGDDGLGNPVGTAPGAQWIACRNMDKNGTGSPASYVECMDFFLAPYPVGGTTADGDAALAPDVVNNSWVCPASEGCSVTTLDTALAAQEAAGILNVGAAGNWGPSCSTVRDTPAISALVLTVGALQTGTTTIAGFSSVGPVTSDGSNRLKPDVVAPGTSVLSSSLPGPNTYLAGNGTSFASPLTAGVAALVLAAQPALRRQPARARALLTASAAPISATACSTSGVPNAQYGYGLVDARAAITLATTLGPLAFHTVSPCRLVDTRGPAGTFGGPALAPSSTRSFPIVGSCGVPSGAKAVALNVTSVGPDGSGDLHVSAAGIPTPIAVVLHLVPGVTRASVAISALDAAGSLSARAEMAPGAVRGTDLVLDVTGYFQ